MKVPQEFSWKAIVTVKTRQEKECYQYHLLRGHESVEGIATPTSRVGSKNDGKKHKLVKYFEVIDKYHRRDDCLRKNGKASQEFSSIEKKATTNCHRTNKKGARILLLYV